MDLLQALWSLLADPNVAYLLLVGGILAAVAAWSIPGTGLAEGLAVVLLGLALIGLLRLPVSAAGLLLLLLGALLFLAELYFQSGGYLGLSGALALGLGGLFLLPPGAGRRVAPAVLAGTALLSAGVSLGLAHLIRQLGRRPPWQSPERLVGAVGFAQSDLDPEGTVWVRGETWTARAVEGRIAAGERVQVVAVEGLRLRVARWTPPAEATERPPEGPPRSHGIGGMMALLLAVQFVAFLASNPFSPRASATVPLALAQAVSEAIASRPPAEQALWGAPLLGGFVLAGMLLAGLVRLGRRWLVRAVLPALIWAALFLALFFSLQLLAGAFGGDPIGWKGVLAGLLTLGLALGGRSRWGWAVQNAVGLVICGAIAAYLGRMLPPPAALLWLAGMLIYDAFAVYVSGHMQTLAEWALTHRLPLVFWIPEDLRTVLRSPAPGEAVWILGFGDVVLPATLTLSAFHAHATPAPALGAMLGGLAGGLFLAWTPPRRARAGLPFLNGGAMFGYGIGRLLEVAFR